MPALVLGPIVRYVDSEVATIWLQTDAACDVEILGRRERTWCIDGLHFALVAIDGLAAGTDHPYEVALDGNQVWPPADSTFPRSTIRLATGDAESRMIFGSCRVALPHEPPYVLRAHEHSDGQGIDALRAYALRAAREGGAAVVPDMLLMLGDQIYADEPSPAPQAVIADRSRPDDVPDDEVADFGEYALAYHEAWSEPVIRWLLSTVPTTMVFDDHEIHAEWRISQGWMDEMTAKSWFDRHIRAGLMAYWSSSTWGTLRPQISTAPSCTERFKPPRTGAPRWRRTWRTPGGRPATAAGASHAASARRSSSSSTHAQGATSRPGAESSYRTRSGSGSPRRPASRRAISCWPAPSRSCSPQACTTSKRGTRPWLTALGAGRCPVSANGFDGLR